MTENIRVEIKKVGIEDCHPNPWNPNRMSERVEQATVESIAMFGMIDPITVRPHPGAEGKYQIIDGEHRHRACMSLEYKLIPVNVLHNLDDQQAKRLTIIANETRGYADKITLAGILSELNEGMDIDELIKGLPYYEDELKELLSMAEMEWGDYDSKEPQENLLGDDTITVNLTHPKEGEDAFEVGLSALLKDCPETKLKRL